MQQLGKTNSKQHHIEQPIKKKKREKTQQKPKNTQKSVWQSKSKYFCVTLSFITFSFTPQIIFSFSVMCSHAVCSEAFCTTAEISRLAAWQSREHVPWHSTTRVFWQQAAGLGINQINRGWREYTAFPQDRFKRLQSTGMSRGTSC